jgi:hypothetical protein
VGQFDKCSGSCPQSLCVNIGETAEDSRRYITDIIKLARCLSSEPMGKVFVRNGRRSLISWNRMFPCGCLLQVKTPSRKHICHVAGIKPLATGRPH